MKKYRNKIIAGVVIALVLVFSYWYGGNSPSTKGFMPKTNTETTAVLNDEFKEKETKKENAEESRNLKEEETNESVATSSAKPETKQKNEVFGENKNEEIRESEKYEKNETTDKELTCTMSVRCDTILENMDWLSDENHGVFPSDVVIYEERTVVFYEGESVFDLLLREMKKNKIHMEFVNIPIYNSSYIEGIANVYEFDFGELSGWMYRVNGWFPNYGCSQYIIKDGDKIDWIYTCDLGADIGGQYSARNGRPT